MKALSRGFCGMTGECGDEQCCDCKANGGSVQGNEEAHGTLRVALKIAMIRDRIQQTTSTLSANLPISPHLLTRSAARRFPG
ncbi:hypothetical protein [Lentzea guizhouensis]|uniref:hypothetical protein n=1 Tax=Lentzea guizhouensis TaxID=1586287 RepID=UPI0012B68D39|nr:hypothetical protein [Lentzea guizhouensis]